MRQKLKGYVLKIGYRCFKIVRAPIKWYWKRFNVRTFGVRIMLIYDGKILLVRHWYNTLWVMPGGGIKRHETPERAAARELREELGLDNIQLEYRLGVYANTKEGKNDTVHCFVVVLEKEPHITTRFNLEVSDRTWFPLDQLPEGTSQATRTRISEYQTGLISNDVRLW